MKCTTVDNSAHFLDKWKAIMMLPSVIHKKLQITWLCEEENKRAKFKPCISSHLLTYGSGVIVSFGKFQKLLYASVQLLFNVCLSSKHLFTPS